MPQARVERKVGDNLTATVGIVAPIAGDAASSFDFAPPPGAGERSMRPAFEGRLGFARGSTETPREINVGVSGHYGWRRSVTALNEAWAVALDHHASGHPPRQLRQRQRVDRRYRHVHRRLERTLPPLRLDQTR